jgi:hypothetical protein|tara:strand:- start:143 stop:349 length:207 start_codon:yes stop_codon:yes gene_type:complete
MKSEKLNEFLDKKSQEMFGNKRSEAIEKASCVFCNKNIDTDTEFKDELSAKEFKISGLCQKCQNSIFG